MSTQAQKNYCSGDMLNRLTRLDSTVVVSGSGKSGDLTVFCGAKRNPDIFPRCRQDEQTTSGQPDRRASAKQQKQGISFCLLLLLIMEVRRSLLLISTID
jgi:hypothetical protein